MSFLRLLMQVHPRVGGDEYARVTGQGRAMDIRPGWNRMHRAAGSEIAVNYIWISPGDPEGRTTVNRPDVPDDQIHDVFEDQLPAFNQTAAFGTLLQVQQVLANQPGAAALTQSHWATLNNAAQAPLRGPDPTADPIIAGALAEIRQASDTPGSTIAAYEKPLRRVVEDYLHLRLTRRLASNIAAYLFARLILTIPSPVPELRKAALIGQIDHMINLASTIRDERQRHDLGAFHTLTCLGSFWAETTQILAQQVAGNSPPELAKVLSARARYIEEFSVHELQPSLLHPFLLVPFGVPAYLRSTQLGIANPTGLYQGAGVTNPAALHPDQIWTNLQQYSATARSLPVPWETYSQVFSKEMSEHLQMFLITMAMGRGDP
jgi:hypothetical protein